MPRLRRFARALARDRDDADDLVQLTLERALRRVGQFLPGKRLDSWMFGIMKNAWIDEVRAGRRHARLLEAEGEVIRIGEASGAPRPSDALDLQREFDRLPADQKLAVTLVLVEGLSYREAAEVAQVPEGTLTSRLARGRATLLARLSQESVG